MPSSGSTIQRVGLVGAGVGAALPRRGSRSRAAPCASSAQIVSSALRSAAVTKSPGPLSDTCRFSTSPKSRVSARAALRAAATMTLRRAECCHQLRPRGDVGDSLVDDHDLLAGADERRHQDAQAVLEHGRLVGGSGGLALHHGSASMISSVTGSGSEMPIGRPRGARPCTIMPSCRKAARSPTKSFVQLDLLVALGVHEHQRSPCS